MKLYLEKYFSFINPYNAGLGDSAVLNINLWAELRLFSAYIFAL